jgi:hypothetical protein
MVSVFELATTNLLSPMILFFALGLAASVVRSDLSIPEAIAKGMSLYLMMAIGFKGGAGVGAHGIETRLVLSIMAGLVLSAVIPVIAFRLLRATTGLSRVDAAAVAAHYGSISIVTFLAATQVLDSAVAAAMETPAIIAALWLARTGTAGGSHRKLDATTLREVALNGSIVVLVGSFAIGWISGAEGLKTIASFIVEPFKGVLCLFLLDMGVIAGRGLREGRRQLTGSVIAFGIYMPLVGAALGWLAARLIGLSPGGSALLIALAASASYIAVPAALRLALPEAKPSIYVPLSLGVTFPFNLTLGIPLYLFLASLFR